MSVSTPGGAQWAHAVPEGSPLAALIGLAQARLPTPHADWDPYLGLADQSDFDFDLDSSQPRAPREPHRPPLRTAAVLIPVVADPGHPRVLFTQRAANLSAHAGQVSFPGGRREAEDANPVATALRETHEETGIAPHLVTPLATLATYETGTGFLIVPVLGLVHPDYQLAPDPNEVDEVFDVPWDFVMNPANHQAQSKEWRGQQRRFWAIPHGPRFIWGATAGMLRGLYQRLYAPT